MPVLELEQNGEFDVVRDEGGLHIVIDDDEDEEKQLEKKFMSFRLKKVPILLAIRDLLKTGTCW